MADNGNHMDDKALNALFDSARRAAPEPDAGFLARLADDMDASLPIAPKPTPRRPAESGFLTRFRGIFAASGLTGAAALGVWIGFVMPDTLNALATGYDAADASGIGAFLPYTDITALAE